uniref:Uncharacterized protein n=1 Tax=Aegilops tauschii subsp. strangulata TaxID=200361 RepID=A0A453GZP2_AEGTS
MTGCPGAAATIATVSSNCSCPSIGSPGHSRPTCARCPGAPAASSPTPATRGRSASPGASGSLGSPSPAHPASTHSATSTSPSTGFKDTWAAAFLTCIPAWGKFVEEVREGIRMADGAVVNTFLGLEEQFVACYEAALGKPVWAPGPFFLNSRNEEARTVNQSAVTAWLDKMDQSTVVYVSFGSLAQMLPKQLYEIGHGLEDSGKPFLWVVKESETVLPEAKEWLQALETRTARHGLVVHGWAPQVAILSHRAVGGFMTHCGWNSLLESVAQGVPVVTWPHFGDQFLNERLAVDVLGVGVPVRPFDAEKAVDPVVRGHIARAVSELMGDGAVAEERRRKCKEYRERAHGAMAKGGSSHENLTLLLHSFMRSGRKE